MAETTIKELCAYLETIAPLSLQESYDNSGLIIGDANKTITGVLITLDCVESVIDEAIKKKCNLIIAHHPIIFGGLKKITGKNYIERTVIKAIQNSVAIYAAHTNMDHIANGVNAKIAEKLRLTNCRVLAPQKDLLKKLVTFCPPSHIEAIKKALFDAGAGKIGNYDECSFNLMGEGTFRAAKGTSPYVGKVGKQHTEKEARVETIFHAFDEHKIIKALLQAHPYEEVAYDLYALTNISTQYGAGMIGELKNIQDSLKFLKGLKKLMKTQNIRYTDICKKHIKKVAVCGGAGSFLLNDAIQSGADIFVTADFKYHQFFDADGKIIIADIGHFETEQFTKDLFYEFLKKKNYTFAVHLSEMDTNPINYI